MLELWKKQFALERIQVHHEDPAVFVTSQWQKIPAPNVFYLLYRWLVTAFFVVSLAFSIADLKHPEQSAANRGKWFIYLTGWGFATCTFQTVLGALMLTSSFLRAKRAESGLAAPRDNSTLKLYKIYWVANITATDMAFGITIIYWSLIYDESKMSIDQMNIILHVFNSVLMLIDLLVVSHPVRIMHFYWPVIYGFFYIIFSIIYFVVGGTSKEDKSFIYPILDWTKPGMTVAVCFMLMLFTIILHGATYGVYRLRKYIHSRIVVKNIEDAKIKNSEVYNNSVVSTDVV